MRPKNSWTCPLCDQAVTEPANSRYDFVMAIHLHLDTKHGLSFYYADLDYYDFKHLSQTVINRAMKKEFS